jgi:AAA15 family ATPase/GTPase
MIQGISIENFRCFHQTEIKNFGLVNLISGKNNAGKTALLEAICLSVKPNDSWILIKSRVSELKDFDEYKNLFIHQQIENNISIQINFKNNIFTVSFSYDNSTQNLKSLISDNHNNQIGYGGIIKHSILSFILSKNEQYPNNLKITDEFDKADMQGKSEQILKAIQLIDSTIAEMKTYSSRPGILYLRRKNEKVFLPIFYFGDAIQRIMRYIITIVNFSENETKDRFLLIDEIENGLHYTAQAEFWRMLFKLAIVYQVQIFATTHSKEMIEAFKSVATQENWIEQAGYFELFRHIKTNEITANKIQIDTLNYKLQHNKAIRGE